MDVFAKYYNDMVGADYDKITAFIVDAIKKYKPDSNLICDLGCGTGKVALNLSKLGYDMIAIDSDENMLVNAKDAFKANNIDSVLLLNQDITDFELYGTVDVVYATLDTLNYILYKNDLKRLFSLVRNYLNYNGLFIFDINTEYKFKNVLSSNNFIYDFDDLYCTWIAEYSSFDQICSHYLTYFEKTTQERYVKYENFQQQRYYEPDYIEALANKYDFKVISVKDNYSKKGKKETTERLTYILKTNK